MCSALSSAHGLKNEVPCHSNNIRCSRLRGTQRLINSSPSQVYSYKCWLRGTRYAVINQVYSICRRKRATHEYTSFFNIIQSRRRRVTHEYILQLSRRKTLKGRVIEMISNARQCSNS